MWMHRIEVDMMFYITQKESLNSDKRLRRNRRPKLQLVNSFQQQQHINSKVTTLEQDII